jgi:uroporphyrin-III C-methyltransferase
MTNLALPFLDRLTTAFRGWMSPNRLSPRRMVAGWDAIRKPGGFVSLVGAGPGSADLITLRGLARLSAADVVFYDKLASPALLDHMRVGARAVYVGKAPGCHSLPQDEINRLITDAAGKGLLVVRLKCGDPGIFGRGAEEAAACDAAGIAWEAIPGVTAASAAAAATGTFLTERGQTERVVLATGHRRADAVTDWTSSAQPGTTLACYMGVSQADAIQSGLLTAGWPAATAVQIVSQVETPTETVLHCRLDGLAELCATRPGLSPAMLILRWPETTARPKNSTAVETASPGIPDRMAQRLVFANSV